MSEKKFPVVRCSYDEIVKIEDLLPHPQNPNRHPESQLRLFGKIIEHQGWSKVLRINFVHVIKEDHKNVGGCADYRSVQFEQEQIEALQRKWGNQIVKFDKGGGQKGTSKAKATIDINPIIKVPIQESFTVGASISGSKFSVSANATATAGWKSGSYQVFVYAIKGDDKQIVCTEEIMILPDPTATPEKPALEVELEALDKAIAGVLKGEGVQSYQFETAEGRRSAERMSLEELRKHREWLVKRIESEKAKASGKKDPHGWRQVRTTFDR